MCGAVALFACLDCDGEISSALYMTTLQVVWARYAARSCSRSRSPIRSPGRACMATRRPVLQIGRSTLLLGSTWFNFMALRYLQLDEVMAIAFSTPFFVAMLSGPMLGEWVGWRRWTAIAVGFVGVLVVTRPGLGGMPSGRAARGRRGALLRVLRHHHAHAGAHRQQRDHAVLFQPGGRGGHGAGRCRSSGSRRRSARSSS